MHSRRVLLALTTAALAATALPGCMRLGTLKIDPIGEPGGTPGISMTYSSSYTSALQATAPAAAGLRWKGFVGVAPTFAAKQVRGRIHPKIAPGSGSGPLKVAAVAGFRVVNDTPGYAADRGFVCGSVFDGEDYTPEASCALTRSPASGTASIPVNRFSLAAPAPTPLPAGYETDLNFAMNSDDGRSADLPLAMHPWTSIPGATVKAPSGRQLGDDGQQAVRLVVPAGTPAGTYEVGLAASALGQELGQAVASVVVSAPVSAGGPGVPAEGGSSPAPAPSATVSGALSDANAVFATSIEQPGARKALRDGKLRFHFNAPRAGKLRLVVQRRAAGKGKGAITIATANRTIKQAGKVLVAVKLTKAGKLLVAKPGKLKLKVDTSFRAGGKTTKKSRGAILK